MCSRCRSGGIVAAAFTLLLSGCERERRELRPAPTRTAVFGNTARESQILPGGLNPQPRVENPSHGSAYEIAEGQRLYGWYNCSGCHFNGGGGIGPPLMKPDSEWIYGNAPENIFDTIVKGRPNGMPSWGGKIPEYQIWQIVTYVKSLNQEEPKSATPVRADTIEQNTQTILPKPGARP